MTRFEMKRLFFFVFAISFSMVNSSAKSAFNYLKWTLRVANYEMKRKPELWTSDFMKELSWNCT